ncbi:hypothetical protein IVA96_24675 [Bradyrhizobium sp. 159]|uniref:hypothetical protein n=1 Tax=Bradyrhizobium sp. 159 TaxID=2782632 RepID=UPI001FF78B90|nr:hypothetical protein [Bradyrhizobium sp. 159]MCK1619715.1 hypothetical protein [Bradyrhizobium sp. 159]
MGETGGTVGRPVVTLCPIVNPTTQAVTFEVNAGGIYATNDRISKHDRVMRLQHGTWLLINDDPFVAIIGSLNDIAALVASWRPDPNRQKQFARASAGKRETVMLSHRSRREPRSCPRGKASDRRSLAKAQSNA